MHGHLGMGADAPRPFEELATELHLFRLEGDECFGHGVIVRERVDERPAVGGGLGGAGRGVRANHPRRVADEAGPTERHARYRHVVDHLQERLLDARDDGGEEARETGPGSRPDLGDVIGAGGPRWQRELASLAVDVGEHIIEIIARQVVAIPDVVDEPAAGLDRSVESRDRVHEDVAVGEHVVRDRVDERGGVGGLELCLGHHPAPCHVAGVLACGLRDQLAAEARPDPVGTHQQVDAFGGVLGEVDHHVIVRRRPPGRLVPEQVPVVAEAGQQRTVDRVPRAEPVRLGDVVGDGAVAREVPDALGGDADVVEVDGGPLDEIAGAVGEETDPRAALFQHGAGAFVDGDVESGVAQDQRSRQPAERPPDDCDPAGRHHLYVMAC